MKKKEKEVLRTQTQGELIKKLKEVRSDVTKKGRLNSSSKQDKDTNLVRKKKKDIARILTYIKQKEEKNAK